MTALHELVPVGPSREPSTWAPVDLSLALDEDDDDTRPSVLRRSDGHALLYPGKVHTVSGESESLKSWLLLVACAEQIVAGRHAVWIDFEDSAASVSHRMLALGASRSDLLARFHYVRPADALDHDGARDLFELLELQPALVVLDGVTEAMGLHGRDPNSNSDVAWFYALLPRKLASAGAAVALIDHVSKARVSGNRFAIGAQHKLAGIDGAAYLVELAAAFGHGKTGIARINVAKDRPGRVREHASGNRTAELHLISQSDGSVLADLKVADGADTKAATFRPTALMESISCVLQLSPEGASQTSLEKQVKGRAIYKRAAIKLLAAEGYARTTETNTGLIYHHVQLYQDENGR